MISVKSSKSKSRAKIKPKVKRINAKQKGSRRERELRDDIVKYCNPLQVSKSGGSLGVFDLVCCFANRVICIQVKSNQFPGDEEEYRLAEAAAKMDHHIYVPCCIVIMDDKYDGPKYYVRVYMGIKKKGSVRIVDSYTLNYKNIVNFIRYEATNSNPKLESKPVNLHEKLLLDSTNDRLKNLSDAVNKAFDDVMQSREEDD